MAAPKGHNFATGRPKGSANKKTQELRDLIGNVIDKCVGKDGKELIDKIKGLEGKEYIDAVSKLMEYILPKLQRNEVSGVDGEEIKYKITMNLNGDRI